jgi:hypothetical protein
MSSVGRARLALSSALLVVGACLPSSTIPQGALLSCKSGADCPDPFVCLDSASLCVAPDAPCVSVDLEHRDADPDDDGGACTTADGEAGVCRAGRCGSACGDGILDGAAGELCDFGAANDDALPDRCRTDCAPARCGDGVVDTGESCDEDSADCQACVRVCALDTVDEDAAPGCEAPLVLEKAAPGITSLVRRPGGFVLTNTDHEVRTLDENLGGEALLYTHPSFISELKVAPGGLMAFTGGGAGELYLLDGGDATFLVDGVDAFAVSDSFVFASRTDGNSLFISRIDVSTLEETRLDPDPSFPEAFTTTPTRAVWVRAPDRLVACPLDGGPGDVEVIASGIVTAGTLAADGEDVWAYDALNDLWIVDGGGARKLLERPGVVAGGSPFRTLAVEGGRWFAGWEQSGESFDDTDDVATLLVGDRAGALTMRARARGFFGSVVLVDDAIFLALNGEGIVRVPR